MTDYPLEKLSPRDFEHVIQALVVRQYGDMASVWGDGPDGGREATVEYFSESGQPKTMVVQAKFLQRPPWPVARQAEWAIGQLKSEVATYSTRVHPRQVPSSYIFATNAILVPYPGAGKDRFKQELSAFGARMKMDSCVVWDYDHICRLLDNAQDVRKRFAELVTPGDLLHTALGKIDGNSKSAEAAIIIAAQRELLDDMKKIASSPFLDLSNDTAWRGYLIDPEVVSEDDSGGTQRSLAALELLVANVDEESLVLIGDAGQGKSTITRLAAQFYRAAWLEVTAAQRLSTEAQAAMTVIKGEMKRLGYRRPQELRFPIRLDAALVSSYLSKSSDSESSILHYVAGTLTTIAKRNVTAESVRRWFADQPSIFFIDGYDEIPEDGRSKLMTAFEELLQDAVFDGSDLRLITTSRPSAYSADFRRAGLSKWLLVDLSKDSAISLAQQQLVNTDDAPMLLDKFKRALEVEEISVLARVPLHVSLLISLLKEDKSLPSSRYSLFARYRDHVFSEQTARRDSAGAILRAHLQVLNGLHRKAGFELHLLGEDSDPALQELPLDRLLPVLELNIGSDDPVSVQLLLSTARDRLALLVSPNGESVGFEIRAFQEFFAAEYLWHTDSDRIRRARFRAITQSSYWSGVARFFAALAFREELLDSCDMRDTVVQVVLELNDPRRSGSIAFTSPGARIAINALVDAQLTDTDDYFLRLWPTPADLSRLSASDLQRLTRYKNSPILTEWLDQVAQMVLSVDVPRENYDGAFKGLQAFASAGDIEAARLLNWILDQAVTGGDSALIARLMVRLDVSALPKWAPDLERAIPRAEPFESRTRTAAPAIAGMKPWVVSALKVMTQDLPRDRPYQLLNGGLAWPLYGVHALDILDAIQRLPDMPAERSSGWEKWQAVARFGKSLNLPTLRAAVDALSDVEDDWSLSAVPWPLAEGRADEVPQAISNSAWREAQERWLTEGVALTDVASYLRHGALQADVAKSGFPFASVYWTLPGEHLPSVVELLEGAHRLWREDSGRRADIILRNLLIPLADYVAQEKLLDAARLDTLIDIVRSGGTLGEPFSSELALGCLARSESEDRFTSLALTALQSEWRSSITDEQDSSELRHVTDRLESLPDATVALDIFGRILCESADETTWDSVNRYVRTLGSRAELPPLWHLVLQDKPVIGTEADYQRILDSSDIFRTLALIANRPGWTKRERWDIVDSLGMFLGEYLGTFMGAPQKPDVQLQDSMNMLRLLK